jgi:hypothetical protein
MNVRELMEVLEANPESTLRLVLPTGEAIPAHFHVTEVGRVEKNFIDCGGTRRQTVSSVLQTWTATDVDHRLTAGKLAKILQLAQPVLRSDDLPVEVEYGQDVAAQFQLDGVETLPGVLQLALVGKKTQCLALDKCGVSECSTTDCCC